MEESSNKLKVISYDADFIPFYVCHNKKDEPEKTLEDCIIQCDSLITNINNYLFGDLYCGFMTVGKCFRYTVNPDYKANRKYTDIPKYLAEVKDYLINKHQFMFIEGYEADDLVMSFKATYPEYEQIVVSPDKDVLYSLEIGFNPKSSVYVYNSLQDIDEYFWSSMIIGDRVDNIKGLPGKGLAYVKNIKNNKPQDLSWRDCVFNEYVMHFGEYEGIKQFYKNYLSLKLIENVDVKNIKLNNVLKIEVCE